MCTSPTKPLHQGLPRKMAPSPRSHPPLHWSTEGSMGMMKQGITGGFLNCLAPWSGKKIPLVGCNAHVVRMLTPFGNPESTHMFFRYLGYWSSEICTIQWQMAAAATNRCQITWWIGLGNEMAELPISTTYISQVWIWILIANCLEHRKHTEPHLPNDGPWVNQWRLNDNFRDIGQTFHRYRSMWFSKTVLFLASFHVFFFSGVNFHDKDSKAGSIDHDSSWGTALSD